MKPLHKLLLILTALLLAVFACNFPPPTAPAPDPAQPPADLPTETPPEEAIPVEPGEDSTAAPEEGAPLPNVVSYLSGSFQVHSLDGTLVESRPAPGLQSWSRPNQRQVIGNNMYYLDSGDSSLGGMVKKVTPAGIEDLAFTSAPQLASLTFAVSPDETKIAWAFSEWSNSRLWVADLNGANQILVAQSAPDDAFEDFFVLEAVRFTDSSDLLYSWQISGIGNILYFGYSTLLRYSIDSGVSSELVPISPDTNAPCWSEVSHDGTLALGTCALPGGSPGMRERNLLTSAETVFPVLPGQQQTGAASFAPGSDRIAYCFAEHGADDTFSGSVAVRMAAGENPAVLASSPSGYFTGSLWATDSILLVEDGSTSTIWIHQLTMAGALTPFVEGELVGLMQP